MENDLYHFSGGQSDANSSIVMSDYECNKKMRNISVQTGEEFSPEFLRDCVSRRTPFTNDASHIPMSKPGHSDSSQGMAHAFDKESLGSAISICTSDYSPNAESSGKIKFLCSFGGRILPRPNDAKLRYVGGDTRIISVKKDLTYNELVRKTTVICGYPHTIKYQLPGEDLDALISVSSDEDLHHMIEEYHDLERISQRLMIFLISCGDANYQYVVAVNGMSPRRSSSRESLESQWMNINPDGSPTAQQKKPANAFGHLNNLMLAGPSSQVYSFPPEIASKSYVLSPPSSPTQFKDPKTSCVRTYENAACLYEHQISCPYIVDASGYETPPAMDSVNHICSHVASHVPGFPFPVPSSELKSPLMYGIDYTSERRCFPNAEKTGPPEDMFSFSPVSDFNAKCRATDLLSELALPANDERNIQLEHGTKITLQPFAVENSPALNTSISSQRSADRRTAHAKYLILGNKDGTFQDPPNAHKDFIQWGGSTLNWMENKEISFDQDMKLSATKNHYASNADFFEENQNLPQIPCQPNLIMSIHAPKSEPRGIGAKCSSSSSLCSSVENQTKVWKELSRNYQIHPNEPDFLIRSQRVESGPNYDDPNAINGNTSFFGRDGLEPKVRKENSDPSNIINVVELPDNESCLSLDCRGPLILPKTTINDGLGGVSDGSMKNFKNSIEELSINNATYVGSKSDNVQEICAPEEPAEDEHTEEAESVNHASDDDVRHP